MKLSEPQKRMLRMMVEYNCHPYINPSGNVRYAFDDPYSPMPYAARRFPPLIRTIRALQRKGIFESQGYAGWNLCFILTPKGREVAKELRDV